MTVEDVSSPKNGGPAVPTADADGVLTPPRHDGTVLDPGGLLGGWQRRNRRVTIPYVLDRVESGEAAGNLARLAGLVAAAEKPFTGMVFTDSDVYKSLEAVAWAAIGDQPGDAGLQRAGRLVDLVALVQEADGYINSYVQGTSGLQRWADPQWGHELYTAGHLFQAAVAATRAGVLPGLLDIATRFADLLVRLFGTDESEYFDGHPQVETALVELYRVTGLRAYLDLARRQLDLRGHGRLGEDRFGSSYFQDAVPIRAATQATGHAVRQVYLLSGAVDVAVETGDQELLTAVIRIWDEMAGTKSYVTGALGSRHRDEAIGDAHELPPDRAYAETCAAIGSFQLAWRLLLATGEARYADAMETTLYNAIPAAIAASGNRFFYSNPLHLRTGHEGGHEDAPGERRPWFSCACCPPNVARLLASVHDYLLTTSPAGIQIHHPTPLRAQIDRDDSVVSLELRTDYPYAEAITLVVDTEADGEWELALRIPAWCKDFSLVVDGEPQTGKAAAGYLRIVRNWSGRHEVRLELRMPVRLIAASPRVDAVRGCLAVARGPVLYALESADLPAEVVLEDVRLLAVEGLVPPGADRTDPAPGLDLVVAVEPNSSGPLYADLPDAPVTPRLSEPFHIAIGPYHRWANRRPGAMRVWIPTAPPSNPQHPAVARSTCFREETS